MTRPRLGWVWLIVAALVVPPYLPRPARAADRAADEARALAGRIDHWIEAKWTASKVQPVPPADDAEFIRRVYLDLTGRIPSILEARDFLDDDRPDKRRIWVDKLLAAETYARHFANVWRAAWLPETSDGLADALAPGFEAWLQERLQANAGYDAMVREVLTNTPQAGPGPSAFYQANEQKAENLAGSTARLFLGVNLGCAQCHAHPFARWSRTQFWEYAAFFASAGRPGQKAGRPEIEVPNTGRVVRARFLDGKELPPAAGDDPRAALAGWMTAADNPFFARAAVNRVWSYFFGVGLVEPVDDLGGQNPPSHPELLDELARQFAAHRYDLKFLIRAVVASRAYQLTSAVAGGAPADVRLFARMPLRGLSAEQLFDSIAEAVEYREPEPFPRRNFAREVAPTPRALFLAKFRAAGRRTEPTTTILQALFLMNGKFMAEVTSPEGNRTLATVAESAATSTARRVETLFLVVLSRKPRPEEAARMIRYVERGGASGDRKQALADVFWALLNSTEFCLNH